MIQETFNSQLLVAGGEVVPVPTTLTYLDEDPVAVEILFKTAGEDIRWLIARSLLSDGCKAESGDGDVKIWPSVNPQTPSGLFISLNSPNGAALLEMNRHVVEKFLFDTYALVAEGAEVPDVDKFLSELFSSG